MAGSINLVTIVGRVTNDPIVKQFPDNTKCNFSVATNRNYTRRDGTEVNQAEFHKIVTSGGIARVAERYVNKGRQIGIVGRLATRSYEDKMGNKRYITEIIAENLHLLGGAAAQSAVNNLPHANAGQGAGNTGAMDNSPAQNSAQPVQGVASKPAEDELPF